ncbi:hypothetical protein L1987_13279 [Smallanthus sonchifolius]|uniref:Uncharacterized protein n=1 Tax=Smallanthus sonchifolius TaxID=185202 RepID=A0ACB9JG09_9ASTR|nr:hypothetical protein L1987_13279 [Smallanthus sonchifolius]
MPLTQALWSLWDWPSVIPISKICTPPGMPTNCSGSPAICSDKVNMLGISGDTLYFFSSLSGVLAITKLIKSSGEGVYLSRKLCDSIDRMNSLPGSPGVPWIVPLIAVHRYFLN